MKEKPASCYISIEKYPFPHRISSAKHNKCFLVSKKIVSLRKFLTNDKRSGQFYKTGRNRTAESKMQSKD